MKKMAGIGLIGLAFYLLFGQHLSLPSMGRSLWYFLFLCGFGIGTLHNSLKRRWSSAYICGLAAFVLLNYRFAWLAVGTWTIVFAGILIWIGGGFLFRPKGVSVTIKGEPIAHYIKTQNASFSGKNTGGDTVFGTSTRYINGETTEVGGDTVFGSTNLYFDNAISHSERLVFSGDAVFAGVKLYVPEGWLVVFEGDKVFSSMNIPPATQEIRQTLYLTGDLVFSSLEVFYI